MDDERVGNREREWMGKEEDVGKVGWWTDGGGPGRQGELNDAEGCSAPGMIGWTGLAPEESLLCRAWI